MPFDECKLPCVAGATLGRATEANDYKPLSERISQVGYVADPALTLNTDSFFRWRKRGLSVGVFSTISAEFDDHILQRVAIEYDPQDSATPRLGDVISALGVPACVLNESYDFDTNLSRMREYNYLYYVTEDYLLKISVGALMPNQAISGVELNSTTGTTVGCSNVAPRWRGFVSGNR